MSEVIYSRGDQALKLTRAGNDIEVSFGGKTGSFSEDDLFDAILKLRQARQRDRQPSYSLGRDLYADRAVEGCSDCRPGQPCYGHGH